MKFIKTIIIKKSVALVAFSMLLTGTMTVIPTTAYAQLTFQSQVQAGRCAAGHRSCHRNSIRGLGICLGIALVAGPLSELAVARCTSIFVVAEVICASRLRRCIRNINAPISVRGIMNNNRMGRAPSKGHRYFLNNQRAVLARGGLTNKEKNALRGLVKEVIRRR